MRGSAFILLLFFCCGSAFAQTVIRTGTAFGFSTSEKPDIVINAAGDFTTNGATDFAGANLQLNLIGRDQSINGNIFVTTLRLNSAAIPAVVTVNNTLTITGGMECTTGFLAAANSGKIIFTGDGSSITGGSKSSFVEGPFFQAGGGYRFFPTGYTINNETVYAPATFENAGLENTEELSVEAVGADPSLTFDAEKIKSINNTRYWQLNTTDISKINSRVSLGIEGLVQTSEGSYAVVQTESTGGDAESLGFSFLDQSLVTSRGPVSKSVLAIGVVPEVVLLVHDLITPFLQDGANDKLTIDQIEQYDFNTVTMLDRWGGLVKRWDNFTNDVDYDFSRLSPGNYIVVVEYGNHAEGSTVGKISQMVTVLKTN
jgi:hypothetical protein